MPLGIRSEISIWEDDRRRHMYIIGQTGTGKSQYMRAMAQQDINEGKGVAFIDPQRHRNCSSLERIPEHRVDDVILFDASDYRKTSWFNILEANVKSKPKYDY